MKDQPIVINNVRYQFDHEKFRGVIEERKVTQHQSQAAVLRDIAEHCPANPATIKNWLYTNSSPDLELIVLIVEYLNVPILDVLTAVIDEQEESKIDIIAETMRLRMRMKDSIWGFEGLYQHLVCFRGFDISRVMLFLILQGTCIPSIELYMAIDCALVSAEQVRDKKLFPLREEKGVDDEIV